MKYNEFRHYVLTELHINDTQTDYLEKIKIITDLNNYVSLHIKLVYLKQDITHFMKLYYNNCLLFESDYGKNKYNKYNQDLINRFMKSCADLKNILEFLLEKQQKQKQKEKENININII